MILELEDGALHIMDASDVTNHEQVVRALIEAGANVHHAADDSFNSLMYACQNGHVEVCTSFEPSISDVTEATDVRNHEQVVRIVLEAGAEVDAQTNTGFTSLILSAQNGHEQVHRYLITDLD